MANIKASKKDIKTTKIRTALNKGRKTEIKTYIKKFDSALNAGNIEEARELLKTIDKKLKRASLHNIIHKNAASRKVSNLTKKLNNVK